VSPRVPADARTVAQVTVSGLVFLASGLSLVVYILTGAPLALVLGVLVVLGALALAATVWGDPQRRSVWLTRVAAGAPAGLIATLCYDASRWLLVKVAGFSASPFAAFPLFGQANLRAGQHRGGVLGLSG
jgi:hypothetical protein